MDQSFGSLNPAAPAELAHFAFLTGLWRCEARVKTGGDWQRYDASWAGRFILDGYAIGDQYRMIGSSGETLVFGINVRAYDAAKGEWNIKWLDALTGKWTDLGPQAFGGVKITDDSIVYAFEEPMAGHPFTRATYANISPAHFTWRGEQSKNRKSWSEFMIVEAERER